MIRQLLLSSATLFAVAAAPAFAQAAADAGDEPAEIVVTAQKRTEKLQDIPLAVTVVGADALSRQAVLNLENAQYLVPSLNFRKSGTTINQSLYIRGVGTATFSLAGEPSISTVLDGVVLARAGEAFSDLVDIERIEVLRGPQGTLFGKNASAGVVNIVTKRPGDVLAGYAEGGFFFGNGNEYRARGSVDLPISDTIRTRLTGFYGTYEGNIFNDAPGVNRRVNGYERFGVRGIVEADLSDTAKLTVIADWRKANDDCCAEVIGDQPAGVAALALAGINFQGDNTRTIRQNLVTRTEEESYGVSAQLDVEKDGFTLTSITAWRRYDNNEIRDGDWMHLALAGQAQLHDVGPQTGTTFSQELRLTSPSDQPFTYVVGLFFSHADTDRTFTRNVVRCGAAPAVAAILTCGSPGATLEAVSGRAVFGSKFDNYAAFGQGTYTFNDRLRAIIGLRFTKDDLNIYHSRVATPNIAGLPGIQRNFDQGVFNSSSNGANNGDAALTNGAAFTTGTSATNLSGKAGLQYDFSDDIMGYGSYSRGYKGPAYNTFFNLNPTGTNVIAPEIADSFEIGLKNTLFGGKLTLNLAAFYAEYRNFQANNPDLVAGVPVTRFTNAGDVSTRGIEMDFLLRPVKDLNIAGGLAFTDAQVDRFNAPPGAAVIPAGTPLGFAPRWKGSFGLDYRYRTGKSIDFAFAGNVSTQSSQLSLFDANPALRAAGIIRPYSLVDLQFGLVQKDDKFRVTFLVKNLFDQSFPAQITNSGLGGNQLIGLRYLIPREADRYFGVQARVNF
ncbi:MAG: TonB-dependent receptor [Alphaproteobacteria bacterium]|nr:TonB-dependent receptor [Alphaproteobacteria bacterium]